MANLNDKAVIDVILGEAASPEKYGVDKAYEDMLAIASVIANRSEQLNVTAKDVASVKSEFNAQSPAPGMEAYRSLAEQAVKDVMERGPVHTATFYSTPATKGNLPSGLQPETQTAAHSYFSDPLGRSINTAKGYLEPVSFSVPTPTPSPIGASAGLLGALAEPQTAMSIFDAPAVTAAPVSREVDPIDTQTGYQRSYGPSRNADPNAATIDFAKAAVGSFFGPEYDFVATSGKGYAKSGAPNSQHNHGRAVDGQVVDTRTGQIVSDVDTMNSFAAHMAYMDPTVSLGYNPTNYMGPDTIHIGVDGRGKQWGGKDPNTGRFSVTMMDPALVGMIADAREKGSGRPTVSALGQFSFPDTITTNAAAATPTPAQRDAPAQTTTAPAVSAAPAGTPANMGGKGHGLLETITADPASVAASTLAAAAPEAKSGLSALSTAAPSTGLLGAASLAAAPTSQPSSSSLASAALGATQTAPSVVTAAPVSTPAPAATPAPTSVPTTAAPTTTSKTDADFRSGRDKDRAAFDPDPNAKDQTKVSIAPTVGRVAGGLLGGAFFGIPGALAGSKIGGLLGQMAGERGGAGLGGLLGSMTENADSFTVDNPSGSGRGLLDVSGGPVTLGSFTATPTRSSGGYKGFDTNTNWSSYTSPLGITTTMVGDNIVGGPGLSPAAGGNAAGFK